MPSAFATAFANGVNRMYARFGVPARYIFEDGYWTECTVIPNRSVGPFGDNIVVNGSLNNMSVRLSEVSNRPKRGERLELLDTEEAYTVDAVISSDEYEHVFTCA